MLLWLLWLLILLQSLLVQCRSIPYARVQISVQPFKESSELALRKQAFWKRAGRIFASYKAFQIRQKLFPSKANTSSDNQLQSRRWFSLRLPCSWDELHELNSQRMMDLCTSLNGFYLKSGQFLSTRHDFMPLQYTSKLRLLQDSLLPQLDAGTAKRIIEDELQGPIEEHFSSLDLDHPIGTASIAQVHSGVWRASGQKVAVKVQQPGAAALMQHDLQELSKLAELLQHTDLQFDMLSAVQEMQRQVSGEFDFMQEAANMDSIGSKLKTAKIIVPRSLLSSERVLVMSFVEGETLSRLAVKGSHTSLPAAVRKQFGRRLLNNMAKAWGEQIFTLRVFHGDPHPGNICVTAEGQLGILDWGLVKTLSEGLCSKLAHMVLALHARDQDRIVDAFLALGMVVAHPEDKDSVQAIAVTMFDTRSKQFKTNPFDRDAAIHSNRVITMPPDLFFVVRTVQMLRGISAAFGLDDFSLADQWAPYAQQALGPAAKEMSVNGGILWKTAAAAYAWGRDLLTCVA